MMSGIHSKTSNGTESKKRKKTSNLCLNVNEHAPEQKQKHGLNDSLALLSSQKQVSSSSKKLQQLQQKKQERGKEEVTDAPDGVHYCNPLYVFQNKFLYDKITREERELFFANETFRTSKRTYANHPKSSNILTPERRSIIWMEQAEVGETLINKYSWATPTLRALRIIQNFSPIIEIGCGTNAYWCQLLAYTFDHGRIDIVGYDTNPNAGGTIVHDMETTTTTKEDKKKTNRKQNVVRDEAFQVRQGGPEVLKNPEHAQRTLFLCYPDEDNNNNDDSDDNDNDDNASNESKKSSVSMAYECLQYYSGDYIIHVGELFIDTTLAIDQAPYGRSSHPMFQEELTKHFHCLLKISLPNWLHTTDTLSVWKRSQTTTIVFADDDEDDTVGVGDEMQFRYIPKEERLPVDMAAPCLQHLLERLEDEFVDTDSDTATTDPKLTTIDTNSSPPQKKIRTNRKEKMEQQKPNDESQSTFQQEEKKKHSNNHNNKRMKKKKLNANTENKKGTPTTATTTKAPPPQRYDCPW